MKMMPPCSISSRRSCSSYPEARLRQAVSVAMALASFSLSALGPVAHALQLQVRAGRDGQAPFLQVEAAASAPGGGGGGGRAVSGPSIDGVPPAAAAVTNTEARECWICHGEFTRDNGPFRTCFHRNSDGTGHDAHQSCARTWCATQGADRRRDQPRCFCRRPMRIESDARDQQLAARLQQIQRDYPDLRARDPNEALCCATLGAMGAFASTAAAMALHSVPCGVAGVTIGGACMVGCSCKQRHDDRLAEAVREGEAARERIRSRLAEERIRSEFAAARAPTQQQMRIGDVDILD
ncbi:unnamed protein product [Amoebophrya sp. A120]|nr:unnamed protein product [Amoebophrya sp. A120]|eukprot:GSA120T00023130001.1